MARRPYSGRTTSPYGPRVAPIPGASTFHEGIDGVGDYYNRAPEAGVVVWYGYSGGWGNLLKFRGDSGTTHYLAHNAPNGLVAAVGSRQAEGAALSVKGMTGTATGVHVHWETRPGGGATINPETWLAGHQGTTTAGSGGTPIVDKDEDMTYALRNDFPDEGALPGVPKGEVFVGNGTDPLVWVSNWGPEKINGVTPAPWGAKDIADRINQVGLRGSGDDIRNIYKSMADARARKPTYVLGADTVTVGDIKVPADPALVTAVNAQTAVLTELLKATKALNPPG